MAKGTKRASPGAETEKNPIPEPELGEEDAAKLDQIAKDIRRAELILERRAQATLTPVYEKRREVLKSIPHFWAVALMNHTMIAMHAQHHTDKLALSYLEDVWIVRDKDEPKVFTIEFHFKENPFFSDSVLKKVYKFVPSNAAADEKPDADGLTPSMEDFSWERDVVIEPSTINWKDDSKNLQKLYPQILDGDDISELGSFFNFFTGTKDYAELGVIIANEVFPDAIDFFMGRMDEDITDDEDDSEDDDEDAEEIDLEKPRAKKAKQA